MMHIFRPEERRVVIVAFLISLGIVLFAVAAQARDVDGRWASSPHHNWFKSLKSKAGVLCCDGADGERVADPDWKTQNGKYLVRLKGQWIEVPEESLVTEPNKIGQTMVWPYEMQGRTHIRCFMPGSMA